jgi:hypothetical protein
MSMEMAKTQLKQPLLIINVSSIAAGGEAHNDIDTGKIKSAALTVSVTYGSTATSGVRVYILASPDNFTTVDSENTTDAFTYFEPSFSAGATRIKTVNLDLLPRYVRVLVRNLDSSVATGAVKVWLTANYVE